MKADLQREKRRCISVGKPERTSQSHQNVYSRAQVAMHNSFKDCWIILDNKVYDVSGYVNDHPGGSFKLLECSGTGKDYIKQF